MFVDHKQEKYKVRERQAGPALISIYYYDRVVFFLTRDVYLLI